MCIVGNRARPDGVLDASPTSILWLGAAETVGMAGLDREIQRSAEAQPNHSRSPSRRPRFMCNQREIMNVSK